MESTDNEHAPCVDAQCTSKYNLSMSKISKDKFLKDFGSELQSKRRVLGISQEELADRAKVHRTYMGRIERGESNPPIYTVYKIAKALGTKISLAIKRTPRVK